MLRGLFLLALLVRYNCFFLLGLCPGAIFYPFRVMYNSNSKKQAQRLCKFLYRAGPAFIKLGQILSTRVDIFSDRFIQELSKLQDRVPPLSNKKILNFIKKDLGEELFSKIIFIEENPIACASVAQVYKIKIKDYESCYILKAIKPNVERIFKRDISFLFFVFRFFEKFFQVGKVIKPTKIVQLLKEVTVLELDLSYEAAACDKFNENFKDSLNVTSPQINWLFVTKNVLVQSWVDGISILNVHQMQEHGIDTKELARNFVKSFFTQVFKFGFFHGDLHPGNILVDKQSKKIVFLDFGIMGNVNNMLKFYLRDLFTAFLNNDYDKAAQIHFDLGWVKKPYKVEDFALMCRSLMCKNVFLEQKDVRMGSLLSDLFRIVTSFGMETQEELLTLQKNLIYVEGISRVLYPEKNIWEMAKEILDNSLETSNPLLKVKSEVNEFSYSCMLKLSQHLDNLIDRFDSKIDHKRDKCNCHYYIFVFLFLLLSFILVFLIIY